MYLAIVGGRDFNDYDSFKKIVEEYFETIGIPIHIISGGAKGVDTMAETYALEKKIPTVIFHPEWHIYGKKAGILRNTDIINASTHVLALPTANSKGTYDSISKARKLGKHLTIHHV